MAGKIKIKVGDKVRPISTQRSCKEKMSNWLDEEKTKPKIGDIFAVTFVSRTGWLGLVGLIYRHPAEKFELV